VNLARNLLLAGSRNAWLRDRAVRLRFVRSAVTRFMPGEDLDAALAAARSLEKDRIGGVLTCLGEDLANPEEADRVTRHYEEVLRRIGAESIDAEISVKLTQLGLGLDPSACERNLALLADRAAAVGKWVWVDMESTPHTDATLEIHRAVRSGRENVGVCLQAYLYRTGRDLESLLSLGGGIRLVKGAYREPASLAYPRKGDVDANFLLLAQRLLGSDARRGRVRAIFGTHDRVLIRRIEELARSEERPPESLEFQMLYGIQRGEQIRLASAGYRFRVLISYGEAWFPWYMRRLAERPANLLFVAKNLFSR
jgi:proline dehydrogenase